MSEGQVEGSQKKKPEEKYLYLIVALSVIILILSLIVLVTEINKTIPLAINIVLAFITVILTAPVWALVDSC